MKQIMGRGPLSLLAACICSTLFASDTRIRLEETASIRDVALHDGGMLQGQLVDVQQHPLAARQVQVSFGAKVVASATTDKSGRFAIRNLRPGTHSITAAGGTIPCQFWAPGTSPPSAQNVALLIATDDVVVRGKKGKRDVCEGSCDCCPSKPKAGRLVLLGLGAAGLAWALDHNPPGS
jgi:hypothetical protein